MLQRQKLREQTSALSRDLILERFVLAAGRMNDRFSRGTAV